MTTYWFALAASGIGTGFRWNYTDTLQSNLPNYAVSNDNGATWSVGTPAGPFILQVNSAVPEPSSLVLLALGVSATGIAMRRRSASIVRATL